MLREEEQFLGQPLAKGGGIHVHGGDLGGGLPVFRVVVVACEHEAEVYLTEHEDLRKVEYMEEYMEEERAER